MRAEAGGIAGDDGKSLGWKDFVALFIALLQTVALPLLLLILVVLIALAVLRLAH